MPTRTYVDSCVLISAFRAEEGASRCARQVFEDESRELLMSSFVELEVIPKPFREGNTREVQFMRGLLGLARRVPVTPKVADKAILLATQFGFRSMDALHIACAMCGQADEFVTFDKDLAKACSGLPDLSVRLL